MRQFRRILVLFGFLFAFAVHPAIAQQQTRITLLHFSDYHAHAVPFYSEGQEHTAGIARAMAYLKPFASDPNTLIFSGGDMMNSGTPAWSDKYQCAEWAWFNGIVKAMALGNHDSDYGPEVFAACRSQIDYPILSSNVLDSAGQPLFQYDGKTYKVFDVAGIKLGVFAVAGPDFDRLVRPTNRAATGATFADRVATTQQVVQVLREQEHVNAVILIGHALYEDDVALAQAVPGIDVIFGTHSHRKEGLTKVPNTNTMIISPFQYLTYVSKVNLTFRDGTLSGVDGELVRMSADRPEDAQVAQTVTQMQAALATDPAYAPLFQPIGAAAVELSTDGQFRGESVLGNFVMDIFRQTAMAHVALSTSSSFREPIPPGIILEETLRTAMPYKNTILVYTMQGAQLADVLNLSVSRAGSDFFSQLAGVRFGIIDGRATGIQVLADPTNPAAGYRPLDPNATYSVATTDFQGKIAGGYKDIFASARVVDTGIDVRDAVRTYIKSHNPVTAGLDGRIGIGTIPAVLPATAPAALPNTGQAPLPVWWLFAVAAGVAALGVFMRRRSLRV